MSQSRYLNFCVVWTELPSTLLKRLFGRGWYSSGSWFLPMMCASPSSQLLPRVFGVRQATGLALQRRTGTLYHLILDLFFVPQNLNLSQNLSYATGFQLGLILLCLFSLILFLVFTTP